MNKYYFHLYDSDPIKDEDGFEFANFDDVRSHAIHFLGSALVDARRGIFRDEQWRLDVTDDVQSVLLSIHVLVLHAPDAYISRSDHAPRSDIAAAA